MVRIRHPDLGVGAARDLASHHERRDPREIRFVCEGQEIEHHLRVLTEGVRDPRRLIDYWKLTLALGFGHLDPPLDVADGFEVLVQLGLVGRTELA